LDDLPVEEPVAARSSAELSERFAKDLETLGPTYVKIGQLLSTRADLLPVTFLDALARLQDNVEPFAYEQVEAIVSVELGIRVSKAFSWFDRVPVAAASLGQVHRAAMRDGRMVAVKVQRPGIRELILGDLDALAEIADFADRHGAGARRRGYAPVVEEFRKSLLRELDYRQEARNLLTLRQNLAKFERIVVPAPVDDYTTSRVLTTDYVKGEKVTALGPLGQLEIRGAELADELFRAYLHQILVDGFVHADPHPGNVFLTEDGRIALLDLGMVTRVSAGLQEKLLQLLLAASEGRGDDAATAAIKIGQGDAFDAAEFRRRVVEVVADVQDSRIEHLQLGRVVLTIARLSSDCGLRVPSELALLGKTLLNLDLVGRTLDPRFDPNAAIRGHAVELTELRMLKSVSPGSVLGALIEIKDFAERLPGRVNKILDTIASNELALNVDVIDEKLLLEGFQKVANRITVGLILAALIVGAAMLMRVDTSWRILGYPGLAMLLFLAAAGGGFALTLSILLADHQTRKAARSKLPK
jgi:predicted unusual protein kinase regulating ubiquinone biosynthesis (AarF/ABC1/UbiB family)